MPESLEIAPQDCERLLRGGVVGRVALSTPEGPHIVPVNHAVLDDSIVIRTSSYSRLGTHGRGAMLAFEADHVDHERHVGWSIVARGRCGAVLDPEEVAGSGRAGRRARGRRAAATCTSGSGGNPSPAVRSARTGLGRTSHPFIAACPRFD